MPADLHQRARDVLAQLSVVSEGTAMGWDTEGHGQPESRGPVSEEVIDRARAREGEPGPPPKDRSLFDHYVHWFRVLWDNPERLLYFVTLAETDLEERRRTGQPQRELATGDERSKQILKMRGPAAEVAAKVGVNIKHIKTLREMDRQDPESGTPWLWPANEKSGLSDEARERLKAEAQERALEMWNGGEGASQKRISSAIGIPRATLQRLLERAPLSTDP